MECPPDCLPDLSCLKTDQADMRTLTERENRTIRWATIGIAIYLACFGGWHVWKHLEARRAGYRALVKQAEDLKRAIQPYTLRAQVAGKLMDEFHLDPAKLRRASVVAEASDAIQKAAGSGGIKIGPVRESPGRSSARELASVQFQGTGSVTSVMELFSRMETLGYPLVIESVQIAPEPTQPGQIKLTLTVLILDFEQWKSEGVPGV